MLDKMNKKAEIVIDTTAGQTENIKIKEIVKQGSIFGPTVCYITSNENNIGDRERVEYSYGNVDIGMSVYLDDIAAAGGMAEIKKRIWNCDKIEKEKKSWYGLKKANT